MEDWWYKSISFQIITKIATIKMENPKSYTSSVNIPPPHIHLCFCKWLICSPACCFPRVTSCFILSKVSIYPESGLSYCVGLPNCGLSVSPQDTTSIFRSIPKLNFGAIITQNIVASTHSQNRWLMLSVSSCAHNASLSHRQTSLYQIFMYSIQLF